jgi:hypothetical protein
MSKTSEFTSDCGTARYKIEPSAPPAPPHPPKATKDTRYTLRLHQEIHGENNHSTEWDLWGFHNNAHIGGPSREKFVKAGTMYRQLEMYVHNPDNKDKTRIDLTYGARKWAETEMSTGSTERQYTDRVPNTSFKNPPNYCRSWIPEAQWRSTDDGFERDVECYFNDIPCQGAPCVSAHVDSKIGDDKDGAEVEENSMVNNYSNISTSL